MKLKSYSFVPALILFFASMAYCEKSPAPKNAKDTPAVRGSSASAGVNSAGKGKVDFDVEKDPEIINNLDLLNNLEIIENMEMFDKYDVIADSKTK